MAEQLLKNQTIEKERRLYPRVYVNFPIKITPDIIGTTVDISNSGLGFILQKPLLLSKAQAEIKISPTESIKTEFKIIWNKHLMIKNNFRYGVCFIRLKQKDIEILERLTHVTYEIDDRFMNLIENFKKYLEKTKERFDNFDLTFSPEEAQKQFINKEKEEVFKKFTIYFSKVWKIVKSFDYRKYKIYQRYFQRHIHPLMEEDAEINRHIYTKPLGYAGDYITMNYIYDYHGNNYLGRTTFEKLINHYTCNISPSNSNIIRKEYFKIKILKINKSKDMSSIASIGAGSVRELIELLKENKIKNKIDFMCLDFEKKAIDYVKTEIDKLGNDSKKYLNIKYINQNIINFVRNKSITDTFDLIYVSGIFDYLKDKIASRIAHKLYGLLNPNGLLIVCNMSAEFESHRGYYEFLGEWNMIHRTKEEMLSLVKNRSDIAEIKFEQPFGYMNYLFMILRKK